MAKESDRDEEETETADEEREGSETEEENPVASDEEASDEEASDEEASDEDEESDEEASDEDEESDDEESDEDESDDEASDEDESDDEASDEDESDDEASDEDEESDDDASAATAARTGTGKRKGKPKKGMTPGARLAAARAAKAARKAAKLGKDKQDDREPIDKVKESDLGRKAQEAGQWAQQNRTVVWALVGALVIGVGGWIGWHYYSQSQAEAAATLLEDALEIHGGTIRAEDEEAPEPEEGEDAPPTFESAEARAEAALAAYRQVTSQHPGASAAPWAHLGAGDALLELERYGEAREAFEQAIASSEGNPTIVWRALEGKGFSFEAEEHWAEALEAYEELSRLDEGRYEPVAKYHMARMYIAQGQREEATQTLDALVEQLREAADDEGRQEFAYTLAQAEVRLRELDPSAVPARPSLGEGLGGGGMGGPPGAGGGIDDLSPEQLQQLIQMMQQKQGGGGMPGMPPGGGAPPGAPPGGGAPPGAP